jgi:hypothetical protein
MKEKISYKNKHILIPKLEDGFKKSIFSYIK